jgi:hypothetical protein
MGKYRGFSLEEAVYLVEERGPGKLYEFLGVGQLEFSHLVSRLRKFNVTHDRILACLVTQVSTAVELKAADQEN